MHLRGPWDRHGPAAVDTGWLTFSLVLMSAIAVVDALIPPEQVLSGLLIIGPALACARLDARRTAGVCAYALLLAAVIGVVNEEVGVLKHILWFAVLLTGSALAVFLAHSRTLRESALATVGRVAQQAILLPFSAPVGGVDVAVRYRSADRDALVGGDLFEVADTGFGTRVLIGDARGKGLSATVTAASALRGFRNVAYTEPSLEGVVRRLDAELADRLAGEDFVTAAIVEFTTDRVTVVNCGHHPPVLLQEQPLMLEPDEPAPPLGMGLGSSPKPFTTRLAPAQAVLLYTDGLAEARDADGHMLDVLSTCRDLHRVETPDAALETLLERMDAHTDAARDDDVALIYCRLRPGDPGKAPAAAW